MSPPKVDKFLFRWRRAFLSSDLPSTTKLVLLVLSVHMKADGSNCWPSQATIAAEASLTTRAVKIHLKLARKRGWFKTETILLPRRTRWFGAKYGTLYKPCFPEVLAEDLASARIDRLGERGSPQLGNVVPQIGERGSSDLGNQVPPSSSGSSSGSASRRASRAARPESAAGGGAVKEGAIDKYLASKRQTAPKAADAPAAAEPSTRPRAAPAGSDGAGRHAPPAPQPSPSVEAPVGNVIPLDVKKRDVASAWKNDPIWIAGKERLVNEGQSERSATTFLGHAHPRYGWPALRDAIELGLAANPGDFRAWLVKTLNAQQVRKSQ